MGFACYSKKVKKGCWYKGEKREGEYNRITIWGNNLKDIPVLCKRKKAIEERIINKDQMASVIKVKSIGKNKYYGFETDGNHKFLLDNFIVSHNSSLMKTVGVLVTMAQAGYYVPCKSMKYSVFNKIMTRIVGNDNILTNSSSFQVEIKELISILNRADKNTLVLIDELSRGTENISAVSLTVATIKEFSNEMKNKFIITTHLHKIFNYVGDLDNVSIKHISIKEENGILKYDRELKDGPSPTSYGLLVAKMMDIHPRVLAQAEKVRKDLLLLQSSVLSTKRSRYNKNLYMNECDVCKTTEELNTHHIREQNEADENGFFDDGSHKNHISNLTILCRKCHQDHHN